MMIQGKKILTTSLFAAAALVTVQSTSHAQVYIEKNDAGQTLMTAQSTAPTAPLTAITGTFSSASDADLFAIYITSPSTFSASTVNAVTNASGVDTELFLLDSAGHAVEANDDAAGGLTVDSALPAGSTLLSSLAPGVYYLGISSSGNEPINSASQLLFAGYPGGDTTAVRGAASGLNPTTESNFNGNEYDTKTFGAYQIDLTGAVPEPSTWATLAIGSLAAGVAFLRRRSA